MPTNPREKARQFALLKAELLAAAIAAVDKLTDDQCEAIYLKIEERHRAYRVDPRAHDRDANGRARRARRARDRNAD